jgi:ABC-type glycerol-3-phosphate transport system substrate-binding protein
MATDPETKLPLNRRDAMRAIAFGAAGVTLAACGGATTPAAAPTAAPAAPAADAPTAAAAADAPTAAAAADAPTAAAAEAAPTAALAPGEPTPEPTPVLADIGTGSKTVVFWHGLGGADGATMQEMLKTYAASKGDRVVRSETYDWGVFYQKLPTSVVAKSPPNLAIMHSWAIQQFSAQGLLQPSDEIFFSTGLIDKADINPALIEAITVDGKALAVPFDNHGWINWVNTKVIKDAGLDPEKPPQNGTEFIEWAQKITVDEAGKHPNEDGFNPDKVKIWATHSSWQRFTLPSTIWQFGGGIFEDKKSLLNDPKTIAAVQYWHDLIFKYHVVPPAVPGVPSPYDLFKTNSIAFMWDGTWGLNFFKDNPDANAVLVPQYINSLAPDGKKAVRFDSHLLVIPTGVEGEALEDAKDLIKWLSDNGETWATSGQVPARLSVQQKPSVQEIPSGKVAAAQFSEIGRPGQSHPDINEIVTIYEAAFSASLAGTTPVEEAMNDAHTQVQAILDRS